GWGGPASEWRGWGATGGGRSYSCSCNIPGPVGAAIAATRTGICAAWETGLSYAARRGETGAPRTQRFPMPSVKVRENEPFEFALRRFKRTCEKAGVLAETRKREYYE